MLELVVHTVKS